MANATQINVSDDSGEIKLNEELSRKILQAVATGDTKELARLQKVARAEAFDPARDIRKLAATLGFPAHALQKNMQVRGAGENRMVVLVADDGTEIMATQPKRFVTFVDRIAKLTKLARENTAAESAAE